MNGPFVAAEVAVFAVEGLKGWNGNVFLFNDINDIFKFLILKKPLQGRLHIIVKVSFQNGNLNSKLLEDILLTDAWSSY